jgi:hypothetical protein
MYKVSFFRRRKTEMVKSIYVRLEDGIYYFYNSEDMTDNDKPVAIYDQKIVKRIIKIKEVK